MIRTDDQAAGCGPAAGDGLGAFAGASCINHSRNPATCQGIITIKTLADLALVAKQHGHMAICRAALELLYVREQGS